MTTSNCPACTALRALGVQCNACRKARPTRFSLLQAEIGRMTADGRRLTKAEIAGFDAMARAAKAADAADTSGKPCTMADLTACLDADLAKA